MIIQSFTRASTYFLLIFSLTVPIQFAGATLLAPVCYRYSYAENYALDESTLPPYVTLQVYGGSSSLNNASSKPLILQHNGASHPEIKLVDSKTYMRWLDTTEWKEAAYGIHNFAQFDTEIPFDKIKNSNTRPTPISPIHFVISGQHNGKPVSITGTLSFILVERDCATDKVIVATNPTTPTPEPYPKPVLVEKLNIFQKIWHRFVSLFE